ncbi:hypothetical protein [Pseudoruegeria sp. HB172150]|uniref:hypothetical protein n=1 Tax=Pseudoruegeria sp. HB172150 TaxID=2721164 RepID=UPI001556C2D2|nr:hypothetical protein [Pseudoruegeria sp. HB172150]
MRWLFRWFGRLLMVLAAFVVILLAPIAYVELACRSEPLPDNYVSILPPEHRRPESRTLLTYPEWHIVHAYDDYARVISEGDPHDFGFFSSITGFWSSLCSLSKASGAHGGFPWETKQMVYTIGVSFTAEFGAKAAYEETLGRIATWIRGSNRAPLDDLSARQAADYAAFLQQTPWYKWDFAAANNELAAANSGTFRDQERRIALGIENWVKSGYADIIASAVETVGADDLTLRMIVNGLTIEDLSELEVVQIISNRPQGIEIETPRYRDLTHILQKLAHLGADFVEIAGNDDILFTTTSTEFRASDALISFPRQGYGDYRHLSMVRVNELAGRLRDIETGPVALEHVHDF